MGARFVAAGLVVLAFGCIGPMRLAERAPTGGMSPCTFWPPPPPASSTDAASSAATWGDAASSIASALAAAGYVAQRWAPIGARYAHGFAVTTRVERITDAGDAAPARWLDAYPDAATLRWLEGAGEVRAEGRFRVLLVAFTDLPLGDDDGGAPWNEHTVMEGPGVPAVIFPGDRPVAGGFEVRLAVYEYRGDDDVAPRTREATLDATQAARLAALAAR